MAGLIGFDKTKISKTDAKNAVASVLAAVKPAITGIGASLVHGVLDLVVGKVNSWIDGQLSPVQIHNANPGQPLTPDQEKWEAVEDLMTGVLYGSDGHKASVPMTQADEIKFLANFQLKGVPAVNLQFAKDNPGVIAKLTAKDRKGRAYFTEAQQQKILENIDWMKLLLEYAPVILKLLLMFI